MAKRKTDSIPLPLQLDFEEVGVEGALACGFHMEWLSCDHDNLKACMSSGAGCGSPWLTVDVTHPGEKTRYFRLDMRKVFTKLLEETKG